MIMKRTTSAVPCRRKVFKVRQDVFSFYICIGCVFTSTLLWMPELVRQSIWLFGGGGSGGEKLYEGAFSGMARILLNLNPLCDAVILVWFNRELKNKIRSIVGFVSGSNRRVASHVVSMDSQLR